MSSEQPPNQFLILNDKVLTTSEVDSVSSVSNLKLELGIANENNNGNLSLFCIDNNPTVRQNYEFRIQNSGSLYNADYIWREQSTSDYYGEQDKRFLGMTDNGGITDIAHNATGVYSSKTGNLILYYGKSNDTIGISYKSVDLGDAYGNWISTDFDFTTTDAGFGADGLTGQSGVLSVAELSNQKLIMVVKHERDLYLYISDDGLTWELYSPNILSRFTNIEQDITNVKIAVSGNYVRIIGVLVPTAPLSTLGDEPFKLFSIVSADRGSSWTRDSFSLTAYQKEASGADRFSFDIVNFDDNGTFLISALGDEEDYTSTQTEVTGIEEVLLDDEDGEDLIETWDNVTETSSENTYTRVNRARYCTYIASSTNEPAKVRRLGISPGLEPQNIYLCNHSDWIVAITVSLCSRNDLAPDHTEEYVNEMLQPQPDNSHITTIVTIKNYEYQMYYLVKRENPLNTRFRSLNGGFSFTGFFGNARYIPAKGILFSSSDSMHWFHAIRDRDKPLHFAYKEGGAYSRIGAWMTRPFKDFNIDNFTGSQDLSDFKTNKHQQSGRLFTPQWNTLIGTPGINLNGSTESIFRTTKSGNMFAMWNTDRMRIRGYSSTNTANKFFFTYVDPTTRVLATGALNIANVRAGAGISDYGTGVYVDGISPKQNWCFIPETSSRPENDPFNNSPHGSCIIWEAKFSEGNNPNGTGLTNDNIVVGLSSYGQINGVLMRVNCTVRHAETGFVLFDNIAGAPLATLIPDASIYGSTPFRDEYWEFRWAWYPFRKTTQCIVTCREISTRNNQWLSTGMVTPQTVNGGADVLNQMLYFGSLQGGPNLSSEWKSLAVHPNNDLGTFALEQAILTPVEDINPLDAIRGRKISDNPTIFETGQQTMTVWGGASGHYNDLFTANMTFDYPPSNMYSNQSPRVHYRTKAISSITGTTHATVVLKSKDDELFYHDAISIINSNVKEIRVSYSMNGSSYGASQSLDFLRTQFGRIESINENIFEINFDGNNAPFQGEINSNDAKQYYLRILNPANPSYSNQAYLIDRSYGNNIFAVDPNVMNASTTTAAFHSSLVGSSIAIYNDRAYKSYSTSLYGRYLKLELRDINFTAEKYGYIGSIVAGKKFNFDVPLNWSYSDNETANQQRFKTRSGISWAYNPGPAERQLSLTMIGDVTQRSRRELRERLKTTNGYGESNLVFITETTGTDREMIFHGYPSNTTNFKNDGWYYDDVEEKWFSIGDLELTFIEIT